MTVTKEKTTTATKAKTVKAKVVKPTSTPIVESSKEVKPAVVVSVLEAAVEVELVSNTANVNATQVNATEVGKRAYEIWQASGCEHGHDVEHWLAAELELKH